MDQPAGAGRVRQGQDRLLRVDDRDGHQFPRPGCRQRQVAVHPVAEAATKSVATPFTGAWADIQLALTNVVVQSIPDLSKGSLSDAQLDARLAAAQKAAQSALDRAK